MGELIQPYQAKPTSAASTLRMYPNIYGRYEQVDSDDVRKSMVSPFAVNVKDHNAKGDDATDDLAAINTAIAYGDAKYSTYGWTLFFPAGVYRTSGAIDFGTKNNVTIRGEGRGASKIRNTDANTTSDILTFGASSQITIKDISIWSNVSRTAGSAIALAGTSSVVIDGMFIWNCFVGVNMTSIAQLTSISNVTIHGPNNDSYGIIINTPGFGDHVIGPNVVISQTNAGHLGTGIYLQGALYTSISMTDVVGWKNGLNITPAASQEVTWTFLTGVLFDTCGEHGATVISGGSTQKVKGIYFSNCWFASNGGTGGGSGLGNGLNISAAAGGIIDDVKVNGSRVLVNRNHGIFINLATNTNINSNSIWGNGAETANTYDGINLTAGTSDFDITDNLIGGVSTSPFLNQQRYAVNLLAGTSNNYAITDNDMAGNNTANNTGTIFDGGTTSGQGMKQVDRNLGHSIKGQLHQLVASSGALNTTETILLGGVNKAPIPANSLRVGDQFRFKLWGTNTSSVGNVTTFRIRIGTAGTTADGAVMTCALPASAATGTNIPFEINGVMTIRTLGAAATVHGTLQVTDTQLTTQGTATTGIAIFQSVLVLPTFATFASTAANYIEVTHVTAATTTTSTFQGGYLEWL